MSVLLLGQLPDWGAPFPAGDPLIAVHLLLVPLALASFLYWPTFGPSAPTLAATRGGRVVDVLFWSGSAGCALLLAADPLRTVSWFLD